MMGFSRETACVSFSLSFCATSDMLRPYQSAIRRGSSFFFSLFIFTFSLSRRSFSRLPVLCTFIFVSFSRFCWHFLFRFHVHFTFTCTFTFAVFLFQFYSRLFSAVFLTCSLPSVFSRSFSIWPLRFCNENVFYVHSTRILALPFIFLSLIHI